MGDRSPEQEDRAALEREAIGWLVRITDEGATAADRAGLREWQAARPEHAQAFAKASKLWHAMPSAVAMAVKSGDLSLPVTVDRGAGFVSRRGVIAGFATAAAAALGYAVIDPPLGLWPSLSELTADYHTATGEQRTIAISSAVSVEMNTRTSIVLRPADEAFHRFELIAGEAIVDASAAAGRPAQVIAGGGLTTASANFDIRCDAATTAVTCLGGVVQVQHGNHAVTLEPQQRVSYGGGDMTPVTNVDLAVVTAWRDGYLMFRKEPLADVIAEINRYRPGRIVLLDSKLGQGLVTARFKLDRLDDVIAQIREVFGVTARILPGGLVLVG
jgi:transmembrane sensor